MAGMQFTIKKDSEGKFVGNVIGTDLFYKDTYCRTRKMFLCINLGMLKVTIPNKSYLKDKASWLGEFGEVNTVELIPKVKMIGMEIDSVFIIRQDWSKVEKTTHKGIFEVFYTEKQGIVAFRKGGSNSELWFSENNEGHKPM